MARSMMLVSVALVTAQCAVLCCAPFKNHREQSLEIRDNRKLTAGQMLCCEGVKMMS